MLSGSLGSALKGKEKARLLWQTSGGAWMQASTPSNGQAGPSRAKHTIAIASSIPPSCTCAARMARPSPSRQAPAPMRIAKLHASATRSQKTPQIADLSMRQYHEIADATMEKLTDTLEALQEEIGDEEFDIEYSSGVLTVKLPNNHGTYVVNKQPPNKQIWLSSPTSGPKRYDYSNEDEHWFYSRDGSFMLELLEEELSEKLGRKVSFDVQS